MTEPDISLLEKYVSRQTTPDETTQVEAWMQQNNLAEEQLKQLLFLPHGVRLMTHLSPEKDWEHVRQKISLPPRQWRFPTWFRLAAAIFLFAAGAGYVYIEYPFIFKDPVSYTITCDQEAFKHVVLPDSSVVTLRKGSRIIYAETFVSRRQLTMLGEATFDVRRNPTKPFIVMIGQGQVRVLGTTFHILDGHDRVDVNVTGGEVSFQPSPQQQMVLRKGEHGFFLKADHQMLKEKIQNLNFLAWETGELNFSDASLESVARDIGDYFNVSVHLRGGKNLKYTSSFKNPTLKEILDEMKSVLGLTYELHGQSITIVVKE